MKIELIDYTPDLEGKIAQMARICYGKEEDQSSSASLIKRLKRDGHFATMRFGHITFQFSEFSRSCSMQVLRHKFLDVLQRSQRYVKEVDFEYTTPPSIYEGSDHALQLYTDAMFSAQGAYDSLIAEGIKAEDARYVLPNACHTKMNIVGSVQAWHDFLHGDAGRLQKAAQWEVREIAVEVDKQLATISPNIFGGTGEYRPWLK